MTKQNMFTLYTSPLSANGRKVLAVAQYLGLEPEIKEVNVYQGEGQTPDYLAINPFGKIPTLVEGNFKLWESNAIIQYIAESYGNYRLSSEDPKVRADIARWMFWESSHWQPAISTVLSAVVGHELVPEYVPEPTSNPDWNDKNFAPLAIFLDNHLKDKMYLCGAELTIADFSVAGMMTYFHFGKFPFDKYPHIANWFSKIEELPAWIATETKPWKISA